MVEEIRENVSIVIPIYGVEKYIERCVRSLFEQTLDSLEYIFVNDCTPDRSVEILERVLEEYPQRREQVRIINHETNLGAAIARKNGILAATGEYIIHCDSDDWVDKNMYFDMYAKAKLEDLDVVICAYNRCSTTTKDIIYQQLGDNPLSTVLSKPILCSLWNKLVRRELITTNDFRYPEHHMMEDVAICAQMFYYAKSVGYIDKPLYNYIVHDESISHDQREVVCVKRWRDTCSNVELIITFLKDKGCTSRYIEELISLKYCVRGFLWSLLKKDLKYYPQWYNTFKELNYQFLFAKSL